MCKAHKLDAESEEVTHRLVIQWEEDTEAIELVGNHIGESHGSNYTDEDHPKKNLKAV